MKRLITGFSIALIFLIQTVAAVPFLEPITANAQIQDQEVRTTDDDQRVEDPRAEKLPADLISVVDSDGAGDQLQDVIVQTTERPTKAQRDLIRQHGGRIKYSFENINALLVEMPVSRIEELAAEESIAFITPDRQVNGAMDAVNKIVGSDRLRQPSPTSYGGSYPSTTGNGVGIAIIDSGLSSARNDDFRLNASANSRITNFKDFCGDATGSIHSNAYDDYGHGTSVAGVAAGSGWGSQQDDDYGVECYPGNYGDFIGVAPSAKLIILKAINKYGVGTISNVIKALDYCVSNRTAYSIRVINLSVGAPVLQSYKTDPLCQAVERCVTAGMVVVCSAGNYGHNAVVVGYDGSGKAIYQTVYGGIGSPANDPFVITVGATKNPSQSILAWHFNASLGKDVIDLASNPNPLRRTDLQVASFSSRGPTLVDGVVKPDLVAPGVKIVSTATRNSAYLTDEVLPNTVVPRNSSGGAPPKLYDQLSGTSFAAPVVAGIVALMYHGNPNLSPRLVKAILQMTAQRLPSLASMNPIERLLTQGAGLVNAYAAVRFAQNIRSDLNQATAGQNLLKDGRTLSGLNEDFKLNLFDQNGNFLEYAVLDSGFLLANGHLLSNGFLLADGHLLANGHLLSNGFLFTNGHLLSNGSVWPDGHLLSNSYAQASCLQPVGGKLYASQGPIQGWIQNSSETFFADGIMTSTGNMDGSVIFSPQSIAIWSNALVDPAAMALSAGAESVAILASSDDTSISGVRFISANSPYFPKQR